MMNKQDAIKLADVLLQAERQAIWKGMLDLYKNMPREGWRKLSIAAEADEAKQSFASGDINRKTFDEFRRWLVDELAECSHMALLGQKPYDYETPLCQSGINPVMNLVEGSAHLAFNDRVWDVVQEMADVMVGL